MATIEWEYVAHDPINPSFGGTLYVNADGKPVQRESLTYQQAHFVLGRTLLAIEEAREALPVDPLSR